MGNTTVSASNPLPLPVHPHACGEHIHLYSISLNNSGSSPRLWGTQGLIMSPLSLVRFIPTPVGNTMSQHVLTSICSVHPHACGEHSTLGQFTTPGTGSSPRLWGTPYSLQHKQVGDRFIPTPVGNTYHLPPHRRARPVHPHACGEHADVPPASTPGTGSSPRLWGTRFLLFRGHEISRFIPTPVGNTPG